MSGHEYGSLTTSCNLPVTGSISSARLSTEKLPVYFVKSYHKNWNISCNHHAESLASQNHVISRVFFEMTHLFRFEHVWQNQVIFPIPPETSWGFLNFRNKPREVVFKIELKLITIGLNFIGNFHKFWSIPSENGEDNNFLATM
jgi:hypothetical protein